jgi:hypothetical protein
VRNVALLAAGASAGRPARRPPAVLHNKACWTTREHLRIDADSKRRRSATRFRGHPRAGAYRFICVRKCSPPSRFEPYRSSPLCVKRSGEVCSCAGNCGRCSPVSRSVLPVPAAARTRAGLHLDAGCAPAGSAPIRSRPGSEHAACGRGPRVGLGPGVACPKSRSIGV